MSSATRSPADPALFTDAYFDRAHEVLARLRVDGPVHRAEMPNGLPVWVVTRYDDVRAALTDERIRKESTRLKEVIRAKLAEAGRGTELTGLFSPHMLQSDPPDHTRLRGLLARDFTARRVELLRPFVERLADELLDALAAQDGPVDLIEGFALPLPSIVISELLGVPEADRTAFQEWSSALVEGKPATALPASRRMTEYLSGLIASKSAEPDDDLLSALTRASADGDRLTGEEVLATGFLLIVAGHETTANLIGNGSRRLLDDQALAADLRTRPELLAPMVEELLRVDSPVMMSTQRFTAEPVEIGGVTIPAGEIVLVSVGSANRDDARFPAAADVDLDRGARGHLAFGHGIHYCLGAPLARLEGSVALRRFVTRFPTARLVGDAPTRRFASIMNGYTALRVDLGHDR